MANNEKVQAVRHDGLKQTQINFYQAGSLEYKDGYIITVDQPCSIIIDESEDTRKSL
ncbi:MAG: polysaccharide lyase beta-sandwich domain-containing protein [Thomasclavelia ramosa]